jgi:diaminopimelate decarboxylase
MTNSAYVAAKIGGLPRGLWPHAADEDTDGYITLGGIRLTDLADRYGTPSYILDEADVRSRCRDYAEALPGAEIAYAGKAFLCRAMASWVRDEGLSLDVCSAGELAVARSVSFPAGRILLHGNAKSPSDLEAAASYGVGRIVIDSIAEIPWIAAHATATRRQRVLLRVTPGVDAHAAHPSVTTGTADQKFGLSLSTGAAADAIRRVLAQPELELAGLHCHLGSQIFEIAPYERAARRLMALMAAVQAEHDVSLPELNLGGGHGVPYAEPDQEFDLTGFGRRIRRVITGEAEEHRLTPPRLTVEPGRAIVARSAVTLYHVLAVKRVPGVRTFVAVDGGMSDNPRPALYGARYEACPVRRSPGSPAGRRIATVAGRHCESGDLLARDIPLPADIRPGDLLAVPGTGAYHHSMASNYNLIGRPPVIAVGGGSSRVLIRRETEADLRSRDVGL